MVLVNPASETSETIPSRNNQFFFKKLISYIIYDNQKQFKISKYHEGIILFNNKIKLEE